MSRKRGADVDVTSQQGTSISHTRPDQRNEQFDLDTQGNPKWSSRQADGTSIRRQIEG